MAIDGKERMILGSGDLYIIEFLGSIPATPTIEVPINKLGAISGGASLEYKADWVEFSDDSGAVSKSMLIKEEVIFRSGLITLNGNTLKRICSTARVTEASGVRTVKVGGIGSDNGKKYIVHFVHKDAADGDIRVSIVGKNQKGFSFSFSTKNPVADIEFKAAPQDSEGTLVLYREQIPVV